MLILTDFPAWGDTKVAIAAQRLWRANTKKPVSAGNRGAGSSHPCGNPAVSDKTRGFPSPPRDGFGLSYGLTQF